MERKQKIFGSVVVVLVIVGIVVGISIVLNRRAARREAVSDLEAAADRFEKSMLDLAERADRCDPADLKELRAITEDYAKTADDFIADVSPSIEKLDPEMSETLERALQKMERIQKER